MKSCKMLNQLTPEKAKINKNKREKKEQMQEIETVANMLDITSTISISM